MKPVARFARAGCIFFAFAALCMAGCATTGAAGGASDTVEVVDYQKIQLVESAAQHVNVKVIWINEPTKRVPVASK